MKHLLYILFPVTLLATFSCTESTVVSVTGQFFGASDKVITLESLSPLGATTIDTTKTDFEGNFSFIISPAPVTPSFYNVRMGQDFVPLLVQSGEKVELTAVGNIYYNYLVDGSAGSELVKEFNSLVQDNALKLDSLLVLYERTHNTTLKKRLGIEYSKTYIDLKRSAITFITINNTSLSSLLPLYQPYNTSGQYIFDSPDDFIYFKMLSDSLYAHYPTSQYVVSLKKDIERVITSQNNISKMDSMFTASTNNPVGFPEIERKNAQGQTVRLSDFNGKVIFLQFTATTPVSLKSLNQELLPVYSKYNSEGFEIFQVYVDKDKLTWLNTVSAQRLPWTTVFDAQLGSNTAINLYNITKIPSSFLIDKHGSIVAKDLSVKELGERVAKLI